MQATASDEFLSRHTYGLAAEYLDLYYSHPLTSKSVSDTDDLQALAAACLSLAAKLDESYRLRLDRLSYLAAVAKPLIIEKEMQVALRLGYKLRHNTYSRTLDEMLDEWDRSPLNTLRHTFFAEDETSYQRYRNIYHLMDQANISCRIASHTESARMCLIRIVGDCPNVRIFTGYVGELLPQ